MARRSGNLTEEDRILWNRIAATAKPLKGKAVVEVPPPPLEMPTAAVKSPPAAPPVDAAVRPHRQPTVARSIDEPVRDKLAKGRVELGGRVDLHGMTQDEAYFLLLAFLRTAHDRGLRYVLVITGKGSSSGGDGVLKRAVPGWFATAPFRPFVSGFDEAARNHGGAGALYVRLRRATAP